MNLVGDPRPADGSAGKIKKERMSPASTPNGSRDDSRPPSMSPDEGKAGSESATTPDTISVPAKSSRKTSQKMRAPVLFDHLADATEEALTHFQRIKDCIYGSKHLGSHDQDALDCECSEDWRT